MASEQESLGILFAKLARISGELGAVEKDAQHQQRYMYHSADAVMGALNPLLSKYQVVIIPSAANARTETGADGLSRWIIDYAFTIADGETGAFFVSNWTSEGIMSVGKDDKGVPKSDDKAMGKAHTYAMKYWLIQLFKISTKDTVDLDQNDQSDKKKKLDDTPPKHDKLSPEAHGLGTKTLDMRLLKELTAPLYEAQKHQDNSINKLLADGVLKADMNADTAAAYVLMHRASGKELGFNEGDVKAALGMTLGEYLKRNPRKYGQAWQILIDYAKSTEMPF